MTNRAQNTNVSLPALVAQSEANRLLHQVDADQKHVTVARRFDAPPSAETCRCHADDDAGTVKIGA